MADRALRNRQRRADPDSPRVLTELIRVEQLALEDVELAAYAGHAGAWGAVGWPGEPRQGVVVHGRIIKVPYGLDLWLSGLTHWGQAPCVAAPLGVALAVWRAKGYAAHYCPPDGGNECAKSKAALAAAADWLGCQCSKHESACLSLFRPSLLPRWAYAPAQIACALRRDGTLARAAQSAAKVLGSAAHTSGICGLDTPALACDCERLGNKRVREAASAALIGWALRREAPRV